MLTRTEDQIKEMSSPQVPTSQMCGLMILLRPWPFVVFFFWNFVGYASVWQQLLNGYLDGPFLSGFIDCFGSGMICLTFVPVVLVAVHQSVTTPRSLSPFLNQ
jgi:hypothetical protein